MKGWTGAATFDNGSAVSIEFSTWLQLAVTWKLSGTLRTISIEITQCAPN